MGEVTILVQGAGETPSHPCPTNLFYDGTRPTPPYAVMCEVFSREPTWCPALPPATHAPRGWANPRLSPPPSRPRGAHHRGQVLRQEHLGTVLLLFFFFWKYMSTVQRRMSRCRKGQPIIQHNQIPWGQGRSEGLRTGKGLGGTVQE